MNSPNTSPKFPSAQNVNSQAFAALFPGYEFAKGYYTLGQKNDKGKMEGKALTKKEPVTLDDWDMHLEGGEKGLGVIPLMADDRCGWGGIDIDQINIDHVDLEKKIKEKSLPLVVARSKSGGAHCYLFLNEPQPAEAVVAALEAWAAALGYGGCEIFPKQTHRPNPDDIGNWLNMPYYGVDSTHGTLRYALKDKKRLETAEEFLAYAEEMRADVAALDIRFEDVADDLLLGAPPCLVKIEQLGGFPDGTRNDGMFNVGVYLRQRFLDGWADKMGEYNGQLCDPPLAASELSALMKSIGKKDYFYKCEQPPIKQHCNKSACLRCKYGVGVDVNGLIEGLSKDSPPEEIEDALAVAAKLDPLRKDKALRDIKDKTGYGMGALRAMVKSLSGADGDSGVNVANKVMAAFFQDGDHLVRAMDTSFYIYTGTHWKRATDEQVLNRTAEVAEAEADGEDVTALATKALRLLIAKQAAHDDVLRLSEEPPPVINCQNGELWIENDGSYKLRPHSHDSFLTYCLNVEWNPKAKCPTFDKAITEIFDGDKGLVRHFLELFGYVLQPHREFASWWMLHGSGSNGKTALMETVQRLMGKDAFMSDRMSEVEGNRFKIGALAGKLMLVDDDVDTGTVLPDGFLKKIAERKSLTGEHKNKDPFNFISCALPVMLANNWPGLKDLSNGTRRRAHIIPFRQRFLTLEQAKAEDSRRAKREARQMELGKEPDDDLELEPYKVADPAVFRAIWKDELAGVLVRAVEGLQRLFERGGFDEPKACVDARHEWLAAGNPLVAFIEDECSKKPDDYQTTSEFFKSYLDWCRRTGVRNASTHNLVTRNLQNLDYTVKKSHGERRVYGLAAPEIEDRYGPM